ncbi:MAG: hypothetical protein HYY37_05580 [Candidatus Aenigmarchaeota archaeon]|nr:hypothetical protein [Candidatus Aenigmarchaeota archaeon]
MKFKNIISLKGLAGLETLADLLVARRKAEKRTIFYLRLYTYLLKSSEDLRCRHFEECVYNLLIAKKFALECDLKGEKPHAEQIKALTERLVADITSAKRKKDAEIRYHKLKVLLRAAQGICVLRMLND